MRDDKARVTDGDREKMRAMATSFREAEKSEGHLVEGADIVGVLGWVNARRAELGIPTLPVWEPELEDKPAMIMWRRGRALGLARSRR